MATDQVAKAATGLIQSLGPAEYEAACGAIVGAVANVKASQIQADAAFAKQVGIPTLAVKANLHDAAKEMIKLLRLVYVHDAEAMRKLDSLHKKAAAGNKEARVLWYLGAQISDTANRHALKRGKAQASVAHKQVRSAGTILVGDGVGPGFGVPGYYPSAA